jgi:pimeloyl-ACP methyl ester carboxylesterase
MSIANLFQQENVSIFKNEIESLKKEALQTSLQGYIAAQEGMKIRKNRNPVLKESDFKKLFIIGKKDPVLNADLLIEEAKKTNSEFEILSGGHMSHIENKIELITILKRFLK